MTDTMAQTIEDVIEIAAPPERVFRALTDPQQLRAWWSTDGRETDWEMDLRIGGKWRSRGHDQTHGDYELVGAILEIDPPRVLPTPGKSA